MSTLGSTTAVKLNKQAVEFGPWNHKSWKRYLKDEHGYEGEMEVPEQKLQYFQTKAKDAQLAQEWGTPSDVQTIGEFIDKNYE